MSETYYCPRCHQEMKAHGSKDALRAYSGCNYTVSDNEPPLTELELLRIQIPALRDSANKAQEKLREALERQRQIVGRSPSVLVFEDLTVLEHIALNRPIVLAEVQAGEGMRTALKRVVSEALGKDSTLIAVVSSAIGSCLYEELKHSAPLGIQVTLCRTAPEQTAMGKFYLPRNKSEWPLAKQAAEMLNAIKETEAMRSESTWRDLGGN